jgi:hypothetical protein
LGALEVIWAMENAFPKEVRHQFLSLVSFYIYHAHGYRSPCACKGTSMLGMAHSCFCMGPCFLGAPYKAQAPLFSRCMEVMKLDNLPSMQP